VFKSKIILRILFQIYNDVTRQGTGIFIKHNYIFIIDDEVPVYVNTIHYKTKYILYIVLKLILIVLNTEHFFQN